LKSLLDLEAKNSVKRRGPQVKNKEKPQDFQDKKRKAEYHLKDRIILYAAR
jgi:hypothetical protein